MRQSECGDAATTELVVGSVDDDEGRRKGGKEGPYIGSFAALPGAPSWL
jgi:hypothetical protein